MQAAVVQAASASLSQLLCRLSPIYLFARPPALSSSLSVHLSKMQPALHKFLFKSIGCRGNTDQSVGELTQGTFTEEILSASLE